MTYNKVLRKGVRYDGVTITAYESYEKFSSVPEYSIDVSKGDEWLFTISCARTTWKKRFDDLFLKRL